VALQVQLATGLREMRREEKAILRPRYRFQLEVAKLPLFDGDSGKVIGFVIAYKLYIRMRMREEMVEEQVQ